jgi:hypothetical protein
MDEEEVVDAALATVIGLELAPEERQDRGDES